MSFSVDTTSQSAGEWISPTVGIEINAQFPWLWWICCLWVFPTELSSNCPQQERLYNPLFIILYSLLSRLCLTFPFFYWYFLHLPNKCEPFHHGCLGENQSKKIWMFRNEEKLRKVGKHGPYWDITEDRTRKTGCIHLVHEGLHLLYY